MKRAVSQVLELACDSGTRYRSTYFDDRWVAAQGHCIEPYMEQIQRFIDRGAWDSLERLADSRANAAAADHARS